MAVRQAALVSDESALEACFTTMHYTNWRPLPLPFFSPIQWVFVGFQFLGFHFLFFSFFTLIHLWLKLTGFGICTGFQLVNSY